MTQPYDKISDALRREYLARSEFNIARVIKNPDYESAAGYLDFWVSSGVLRREPDPAIYIYRQVFTFEGAAYGRTGLICLVSLDDEDLVVRGHETVLDRPLADRLELIRRTKANEGLVFTLFSDPELKSDRCFDAHCESHPADVEVIDDFGVNNQLWAVSDPNLIAGFKRLMAGCSLYIADGHHRFQTSVQFHRECVRDGLVPAGPESFDKRMVALFNMESEGLRILPTHRGVRGLEGLTADRFLQTAAHRFDVVRLSGEEALTPALDDERHGLGVAVSDPSGGVAVWLLRLKAESLDDTSFMSGVGGPVRELDVTILHEGILASILGLDSKAVAGGEHVSYFRDRTRLLKEVAEGTQQIGFVLRPTSLDQVRRVSEHGAKMPQKSTDFYPKLLTGLVLMKMEMSR